MCDHVLASFFLALQFVAAAAASLSKPLQSVTMAGAVGHNFSASAKAQASAPAASVIQCGGVPSPQAIKLECASVTTMANPVVASLGTVPFTSEPSTYQRSEGSVTSGGWESHLNESYSGRRGFLTLSVKRPLVSSSMRRSSDNFPRSLVNFFFGLEPAFNGSGGFAGVSMRSGAKLLVA